MLLILLDNYAHSMTGTIPAAWEQAGAFPVLQTLYFVNTLLTGTLPSAWGSRAALHELQSLIIISCTFTGKSAVFADSEWSCQTTSQCRLLICAAQSSLHAGLASAGLYTQLQLQVTNSYAQTICTNLYLSKIVF